MSSFTAAASPTSSPAALAENLAVCLPATVCTAEVCPPPLGSYVDGQCVMAPGYTGVQALPQGWVTSYRQAPTEGCSGVIQVNMPPT